MCVVLSLDAEVEAREIFDLLLASTPAPTSSSSKKTTSKTPAQREQKLTLAQLLQWDELSKLMSMGALTQSKLETALGAVLESQARRVLDPSQSHAPLLTFEQFREFIDVLEGLLDPDQLANAIFTDEDEAESGAVDENEDDKIVTGSERVSLQQQQKKTGVVPKNARSSGVSSTDEALKALENDVRGFQQKLPATIGRDKDFEDMSDEDVQREIDQLGDGFMSEEESAQQVREMFNDLRVLESKQAQRRSNEKNANGKLKRPSDAPLKDTISLKMLRQWDELRELVQNELVDAATIERLLQKAIPFQSGREETAVEVTFEQFAQFMDLLDNVLVEEVDFEDDDEDEEGYEEDDEEEDE